MKIEIILEIILILIGLYLAMFKSYFQEKGKNIATSEDIEELTLKVESVKQQFLEKNANLKAKLDLLTNLQINHKNDERLALIDFHKKLKNWISLLTESSPSLVDDYDNDEIQTKAHYYNLTYTQVLAAEAILELYVGDDKLTYLIYKLKIQILENLVSNPIKYLLHLKHNNFQISQLESEQDYTKKTERHKELLDERRKILEEYQEKMIAGYKLTIVLEEEYRQYIKEYMSKIPEE